MNRRPLPPIARPLHYQSSVQVTRLDSSRGYTVRPNAIRSIYNTTGHAMVCHRYNGTLSSYNIAPTQHSAHLCVRHLPDSTSHSSKVLSDQREQRRMIRQTAPNQPTDRSFNCDAVFIQSSFERRQPIHPVDTPLSTTDHPSFKHPTHLLPLRNN